MILLGRIFYILLQSHIPDGLAKLSESFEVGGKVRVIDYQFASLTGNLSAVLGWVFGSYLFLTKGVSVIRLIRF